MLFGKAVKIENCAAMSWSKLIIMLHVNSRGTTFEYQHARLNNIFFLLFDCKSRKGHQQVARPGDQEFIFGRPRPNVSHLRRPGAVRVQPCFYYNAMIYSQCVKVHRHTKKGILNMKNLTPPMRRPTHRPMHWLTHDWHIYQHHRCVDWHTTDMLADMSDNTTDRSADTLPTH